MKIENFESAVPGVRIFPDGRMDSGNAAVYLGVSPKSLAVLRSIGGGPAYFKLGKRCFYKLDDLQAWVAARRATSTADYRARREVAVRGAAASASTTN